NDSDKSYAHKDQALELFTRYWANPGYASGGEPGVWCRFRRGRVEFFMLDGRFHRDPQEQEPDAFKTQFGEAQWRWLEACLGASDADFKVLCSPAQVLADYHSYEGWWSYPADRERLLRLVTESRIDGLVLLSGDRHIGEVLVGDQLGYPLYEFCSSPLAAGIGSRPPDELPGRVPGTLVTVENFGLLRFEFSAPGGPRLRYAAHDVRGAALHPEVVVPLAALRWP
ncbi:MAG: alkaline phosphatase D family protein, partial [Planctomycetes bacterium]|nr:alkaline phosphatase D family protein [Planctomycetota bacterium]